ncbi:hypothetical protein HHI36_003645 [Cryptolaemus montrouzieri]|uniref:Uncharacterized protein n=1 Tax=Cryptolaemus montrouzieri TaxID=559131 RepID=A0ABD2PEK2_9CUCU
MSRSNDKRIAMLRYGEYSPNNPELRVHAQPFLGIGEYEQQQTLLRERRRDEYLSSCASKPKIKKAEFLKDIQRNILPGKYSPKLSKGTQTDIQNIQCPLIQYDRENPNEAQKELSPQRAVAQTSKPYNRELTSYRRTEDQRPDGFGNGPVNVDMDKPKGILTNRKSGSPRDRFLSNLKHTYTPSFMDGFSYSDRTEELERERKKRDAYNYELRLQIEDNRRMKAIKDEQDRREQELENRRLEQQLLRMQEEALVDDVKSSRDDQVRRHSEDYLRRRTDLGGRSGYRKHTDSESSVLGARNALSHYSPPVSRRTPFSHNVPQSSVFSDPLTSRYNSHSPRYDFDSRYRRDTLNRLDSLNVYDSLYDNSHDRYKKNAFARFDSLSRIDSLGARSDPLNKFESMNLQDDLGRTQRRHSATQQDLSLTRRSPKLQRRSNSGRFDDQLPIPLLKAHSPVARELKNSIPFNSGRTSSEACRKLEDKWQVGRDSVRPRWNSALGSRTSLN